MNSAQNRNFGVGGGGRMTSGGGGGGDSDDDDLYSGYNTHPRALSGDDLEFDEPFGMGTGAKTFPVDRRPTGLIMTSRGRTPGTAMGARLGTAAGFARQGTARSGLFSRGGTARPITGIGGGDPDGMNRPMTAVRGAGYTAGVNNPSKQLFDPLNQGNKSATPSIELKLEDTPELKIKQLEERISGLVEESVLISCKGNSKKGLELAKEAVAKEKSLGKLKEQAGAIEAQTQDWDLTFMVLFNLATQYEACEMYTEALSTYQLISKNKFLPHGPKVKINIGNIFMKQNNPGKAIKMYRMAMDQLANSNRELRLKLMHNMGIVLLQLGHAQDAFSSFQFIMAEKPSFKTGLHLVISAFKTGDPDKTKASFQELLEVPIDSEDDEDKYTTVSDDPVSQLLLELLKNDKLRKLEKERKLYGERCILSAARMIAPILEPTFSEGYHWATEAIKASPKHASLAHVLEISKAIVLLKQRDLDEAISILKSFEKKETKVATAASSNLAFLYFLKGELAEAQKYGEMARNADFYNSSAYVNLGNVSMSRGDFETGKQYYLEALKVDSACAEAHYNHGLANQSMKFYEEALESFQKVMTLVRNHPHVTFQIGQTFEMMGNFVVANEWYLKALALAPSDTGLLRRLGYLCQLSGDTHQAYHYYADAFKYDPTDLSVILWLAAYMSERELWDKAMTYYQTGQDLDLKNLQWSLSIASTYRQMGSYTQALEVYQRIWKEEPENVEALENLAHLSRDMGRKDAETYFQQLRKLKVDSDGEQGQGRRGLSTLGAGDGGGSQSWDPNSNDLSAITTSRGGGGVRRGSYDVDDDEDLFFSSPSVEQAGRGSLSLLGSGLGSRTRGQADTTRGVPSHKSNGKLDDDDIFDDDDDLLGPDLLPLN